MSDRYRLRQEDWCRRKFLLPKVFARSLSGDSVLSRTLLNPLYMPFEVRRVIAASDSAGKAVVVTDERLRAVSRGIGENITGCEMWSTDRMPVDTSTAADAPQRAGYVKHYLPYNYVGNGQGTTFGITEWAPDHARFTHRTQTVDYDVVLSGEFDLELDGGEVLRLRTGDVVVLRDCTQIWVSRGDIPDAAFEVNSSPLEPIYPA